LTSAYDPNPALLLPSAIGHDSVSSPSSIAPWTVTQQHGLLQPSSPPVLTQFSMSGHLISPATSDSGNPCNNTTSALAMWEDRSLLSSPPTGISPSQISPAPPTSLTSSFSHDRQEYDLEALPTPPLVFDTTMTLDALLGPPAEKCVSLRTTGVSLEMKRMMGVFRLDPFATHSHGRSESRLSAVQGRRMTTSATTAPMTVEDVGRLAADAEDGGIRLRDHAICYDGTWPGPLQAPSVLVKFQVSASSPSHHPPKIYFIIIDTALTHNSLLAPYLIY
jgi:hypothetical protein